MLPFVPLPGLTLQSGAACTASAWSAGADLRDLAAKLGQGTETSFVLLFVRTLTYPGLNSILHVTLNLAGDLSIIVTLQRLATSFSRYDAPSWTRVGVCADPPAGFGSRGVFLGTYTGSHFLGVSSVVYQADSRRLLLPRRCSLRA